LDWKYIWKCSGKINMHNFFGRPPYGEGFFPMADLIMEKITKEKYRFFYDFLLRQDGEE
jgi:hypothetical protein